MNTKTIGKVLLVAIVVLGLFTYASAAIPNIPVDSVPSLLVPVWEPISAFFSFVGATAFIGFVISISGYLIQYFQTNHQEEYKFDKLAKTLAVYIGILTSVLTAGKTIADILPPPMSEYAAVALTVIAAVIVLLDVAKKTISELIGRA